jgi:hypothetical protein
MLRALCDHEPFLARCNQLSASIRIDSLQSSKDVSRQIIERSPLFWMSIRDGHLWKADPVLVELPPSIKTVSEAIQWKIANPSGNAGEIAYGKEIIVGRASHALSDGGHWVDLMNFHTNERPKRPRIWIHTITELFGAAFERFTNPCSLNLAKTAMILGPSYPRRRTATVVDRI